MTLIEINKRIYPIPESWNELSQRQLFDLMDCLFVLKHSNEQVVLKMLQIMCNMSHFQFYRARAEEMSEYFYLLEVLLTKKIEFTRQIVPQYEGLFGPDDRISNMVMDEFIFSEDYFTKWRQDESDINSLNNLVATLYREPKRKYDFDKNPDGDPRVPFNQNICSHNANLKISKWGMNAKLAIATWYEGCRMKLVDDNEEVFGGAGEAPKYGLISIIRAIAKNGVLGDFNSVEKKYVSLIMIELNESIAEAKAYEKSIKP